MSATLIPPEREKILDPEHLWTLIQQITGRDSGQENWGIPITHTTVDDDTRYAHVIRNLGTGGALQVIDSSGNNQLLVGDGGVNITGLTLSGSLVVWADLTVNGNTALGNANSDTVTVIGVSTFRNAANTFTQMKVDAGNNRVLIGSGTAISGATSSVLEVTGLTYLAPASAGEVALNIWRSTAAGSGWGVGVTATDQLKFTDNGGQGIVTIGDTSSTYQLEVTGDFHVTDDSLFSGDMETTGNLLGTTGTFDWQNSGNSRLKINSTGVGAFGATPVARPTVTGSRGGNAALASLLTALGGTSLGWITDSSS